MVGPPGFLALGGSAPSPRTSTVLAITVGAASGRGVRLSSAPLGQAAGMEDGAASPLWEEKAYAAPSVFRPENLLREGRRQRGRPDEPVPEVCILDPDGDVVAHLTRGGRARPHGGWGCFHTTLHAFDLAGVEVGIVGHAVGAPFAVLVAEQLAAAGCSLVISLTSAGAVHAGAEPVPFVIVERALRDEGTSLHYLPPGTWAAAPPHLLEGMVRALHRHDRPVVAGATWTTDAPYRETEQAIARAAGLGIIAVEMEAAGLYAYAQACQRDVLCLAHLTNIMATGGDDFEKGDHAGAIGALDLIGDTIAHLQRVRPSTMRA